jgi:nicotinate (nicotinamide) nucleotide adenylyltransferase
MGKVGIFAGTFDPVHHGHVQFALAALKAAKLSRVVLLPEPQPWRKKQPAADLQQRRAMIELAIHRHPKLELGGTKSRQFSIEKTLPLLIESYGPDLVFLFGSDVFMNMKTSSWPGLRALLRYPFVIGLRETTTQQQVMEHAISIGANIATIETDHADHASKHVRGKAHEHPFIDPPVARYIAANNLYGPVS